MDAIPEEMRYELKGADGFIVELYMPAVHAAGMKRFLKKELNEGRRRPFVEGYSVYGVNGAFKGVGGKIYREKTIVVRIFFDQKSLRGTVDEPPDEKAEILSRLSWKVKDMLLELTRVSKGIEEQIWAVRTDPHVYKFVRIAKPKA
jgi:hypothetical protein